MNKKVLRTLVSLMLLGSLTACKEDNPDNPPVDNTPVCTVESHVLMENTPYETPVYTFTSNVPGPRCCIVGGIHGDEIAGWMAAEELIKRTDYVGTVMIIPYANRLADTLQRRYPGYNNTTAKDGYITDNDLANLRIGNNYLTNAFVDEVKNVKFTDLNREFPGDPNGTPTQQLANALYTEVMNFNPHYLVDLHEARKNYTSSWNSGMTYFGSSVITGNRFAATKAIILTSDYNEAYADDKEYIEFCSISGDNYSDGDGSLGSAYNSRFCMVMGEALLSQKTRVFTFETNREASGSKGNLVDARPVRYRITEQLNMTNCFLSLAYTDWQSGKLPA